MYFIFWLLNAVFSLHYCVCQPDRPGPICTLEKKCSKFSNENQIIHIGQKRSDNSKQSVDIYNILNELKVDSQNQIQLDFDIFGSLPSKPITFNFTENVPKLKFDRKLPIFIKIRGCEWKQIINIIGLNSKSNYLKFNNSQLNISLSISDITVSFDQPQENLSSSLYLDTLSIQKSKLIAPKGKFITFNTRVLYTDTISSYSAFTGKIITNQLTYLDTQDPVLIKNFKSPIQVEKVAQNDENKKKKKNLLEDTSSSRIPSNFKYVFCLGTKNNLAKAFENSECEMHVVPHDDQHYINIDNKDIIEIIRKAPANEQIRFYLTATTSNDPCTFILPPFETDNHSVLFQVADPDYPTCLTLKTTNNAVDSLYDKNVSITFNTISIVKISASLLSSFYNMTLRSSQITFADGAEEATIQHLVTDSYSISLFVGKLTIEKSIVLRKSTPKKLKGNIFLSNNSKLTVPQVSNFPLTIFNTVQSEGVQYRITLCDEDEHDEMHFYFNKGNINFEFSDDIRTVTDIINLTFRSDAHTFDRNDLVNSPDIFITTLVPTQGLNITFGAAQTNQWPRTSVFTFENQNPGRPTVYLTINDGQTITEENIEESIFMNFYNVSVCLLTHESFNPFLFGLNKNYNVSCPYPLPHFVDPKLVNCYQTGAYNIDYLTLDTKNILRYVKFDGSSVQIGVEGDKEHKIPPVYHDVVIQTACTNVGYEVNKEKFDVSKLRNFHLMPMSVMTVNFTNDFLECFREHEDGARKLKIDHNSNDLFLVTNDGKFVPSIGLDDQVQGVHFVTSTDEAPLIYDYTNNSFFGSRIGPSVDVKYHQDITVEQPKFLAEKVAFNCEGRRRRTTFVYFNRSVCDYTFTNTDLAFVNANRSDPTVNVSASSVTLQQSNIVSSGPETKLNFEVDYLTIFDIASIPAESFSSPIVVRSGSRLVVNSLTKIVFSSNSIQLFDNNRQTPIIKSISSDTPSSPVRAASTAQTAPTGLNVETSSKERIDLVVDGTSLPDNFDLKLAGSDQSVFVDKSFNNVQVPDTFSISSDNKYNIDTDLVELPKGIGEGNVNVKHRKQKLTKDVGFIVFIVIFAVVFLIGLVLCVCGLTCLPHEEAYDMSEGSAELIEDSPDESDENEDERKKEEEEGKIVAVVDKNNDGNDDVIEDDDDGTDSYFFDETDNGGKNPPSKKSSVK